MLIHLRLLQIIVELKTHKLTGNLNGLWSCSVAYNCRIIFSFSDEEDSDEDVIFIIDIGSHDEVY
ncbi:type II toxin-antitoxin system RelE/ParE family toxin [Roseofilum casamattae]|uniref:type II toxin-antitoxin system RelE/ParE family toxin n=1 Tax=Roseofilum casamattae TaxID=3082944 RepID=UPI003218FC80